MAQPRPQTARLDVEGKSVKAKEMRVVKQHVWRMLAVAVIGLVAVPAAASASVSPNTAAPASRAVLADLPCDRGAVQAFARVKGTASGFPDIYSTSTAFSDIRYNCTGGAISVRRAATGVYLVRFSGLGAKLAVATNNADGSGTESIHNDNILTVAHVTDDDGLLSFRVEVQDSCGDCSSGTDPQNGQFTILVL
jgi:hypothetical protein